MSRASRASVVAQGGKKLPALAGARAVSSVPLVASDHIAAFRVQSNQESVSSISVSLFIDVFR